MTCIFEAAGFYQYFVFTYKGGRPADLKLLHYVSTLTYKGRRPTDLKLVDVISTSCYVPYNGG